MVILVKTCTNNHVYKYVEINQIIKDVSFNDQIMNTIQFSMTYNSFLGVFSDRLM